MTSYFEQANSLHIRYLSKIWTEKFRDKAAQIDREADALLQQGKHTQAETLAWRAAALREGAP